MAASKHQQAAAQFAAWLNTDPTATAALVSDGGIYPADTAAEAALSAPPSYFSNQPTSGRWPSSTRPRPRTSPGART